MASLNCTLNGIRYNNAAGSKTNWSNYSYTTSGSAYAGWAGKTGIDGATVFKITVPSFSGVSSSISINLKVQNQVDNGGATTLNWALATTDAYITGNKYADGSTYPLTGNGEIANGNFSFNLRYASYQNYTFTINTSAITAGGTYYLILYRYNDTGISFQYPSSVALTYVNTYTISYNANGGSSTPASQTKTAGVTLKLSAAISRGNATATVTTTFNANGGSVSPTSRTSTVTTSYSFTGWKASNGTVYAASSNYTTDAATTMTAQWSSSTSGAAVTLPTPSRTGYTFDGWYTAASGGSKVTSHKPTANNTLYAHWTIISYTVSYNANGGTSTPSTQTKTYGTALTLRGAISKNSTSSNVTTTFNANGGSVSPTSTQSAVTTSYSFAGWKATNGSVYAASGSYTENAATTMTAQWSSSTSGAAVSLPTPSRTGYTFNGWYTAASGGSKVTSHKPTANNTLYAHWSVNSYSFNIDGIDSYGLVDVYINGALAASNVSDYNKQHPYGTTFEIRNIRANTGYTYNGVTSGSLSGTITANTNIVLNFSRAAFTLSISNDANTLVFVKRNNTTLTSSDAIYYGDVLTITFTADSGSSIQTHTVNGVAFTSGGTHTVTGNVTIIVSSISNVYALTINQGAGTSIAVKRNGSVLSHGASIAYGDVLTISIVANTGYQLATTSHANGSSITVTGNVSISATASVLSYTLSISSGQNTSISVRRTSSSVANAPIGSLSTGATIYHFDVLKIDFYAADGYIIDTHTINGYQFTSGKSSVVTSNVTVASTAVLETVALLGAMIGNGTSYEIAFSYIWDGNGWVISAPHVLL